MNSGSVVDSHLTDGKVADELERDVLRVGGDPCVDVFARFAAAVAGEAEADMPCLAVGAVAQFDSLLPLATYCESLGLFAGEDIHRFGASPAEGGVIDGSEIVEYAQHIEGGSFGF